MVRCLVVVGVAILGCLSGTEQAARAGDAPLKIGMVQGMFRDVQPTVVHALARPFRNLMEKQTGLTGNVEICADSLAMAKKMQDQKLDIAVFHGFEFAWAKTKYADLTPLVVAVPQGKIVQAHVVVHVDSTAKKFADLEGESLFIPRGAKAHCLAYLEKLREGLPKSVARVVPKSGQTPEEALNAVSSGEQSAALVDAAAYSGYQNLQPGAAKQLRILCSSEQFPQTLVAVRKGTLSDGTLLKLKDGLTTAHKTPQYKPLMMMWNLQGFEEVPSNYEEQLQKCIQSYPRPTTPTSTEAVKKD